jgi:hypothetical protein
MSKKRTTTHEVTAEEAAARAAKKAATAKAAKTPARKARKANPLLPPVGSKITRTFKGREIEVTVTEDGLKYEGETYRSLSGLARTITGYPAISGPAFFHLTTRAPKAPATEAAKAAPKTDGKRATKAARKTSRKGSAR